MFLDDVDELAMYCLIHGFWIHLIITTSFHTLLNVLTHFDAIGIVLH